MDARFGVWLAVALAGVLVACASDAGAPQSLGPPGNAAAAGATGDAPLASSGAAGRS